MPCLTETAFNLSLSDAKRRSPIKKVGYATVVQSAGHGAPVTYQVMAMAYWSGQRGRSGTVNYGWVD